MVVRFGARKSRDTREREGMGGGSSRRKDRSRGSVQWTGQGLTERRGIDRV